MRVAVLCDVHGNLPALEAVLAEVASLDVDRIVCGGDVVAGPFPRECLDALVGLDAVFVRGNADRESPRAPEGTWEWIAGNLDPLSVAFLHELPQAVSLGGVLYCHGSPRDDDEILTRDSSDERFRAALEGVEESPRRRRAHACPVRARCRRDPLRQRRQRRHSLRGQAGRVLGCWWTAKASISGRRRTPSTRQRP